MIGGLAFSLGLVLVVVAGAELFTAPSRLRCSSSRRVFGNLVPVTLGNIFGGAVVVGWSTG